MIYIYELSALDYLLYNEPVEYVNLLLPGELKDYMHQRPVYLQDKNNMI